MREADLERVKRELALLDQLHDRRPRHQLRDRARPDQGALGIEGAARLDIGIAVAFLQQDAAVLDHAHHHLLAAEGFVALAPDMYHGQTASEPDGAGKLFMALNIARANTSQCAWPVV